MTYPQLTGLSLRLWHHSLPTFEKIAKTPLVTGLITGLSKKKFDRFTQQDIYYLEDSFQPVMKALREKATDPRHKALFSQFIIATDIELTQLRKQLSSECTAPSIPLSEVCKKYGEHLLKTTREQSYGIALASCLPCFLFFPGVGKHIISRVTNLSTHPQAEWIKIYAEELVHNAYLMASLVNESVLKEEEKVAIAFYMISAGFELRFFEDALESEISCSNSMSKIG